MSNKKDIAEKTLQSFNDVFADIVNALLFEGREVIKEDELEIARARSSYTDGSGLREQERDEAKFWKHENIRIALVGFENQSGVDADMPIRVIGYDGSAYRDQLYTEKDKNGKRRRNKNKRYPVVTLVLYFGMCHWKKPLTLHENLGEIEEEMLPFVNDYKVHLFEIAWLTDEQLRHFKSDFRFVAEYYVNKRRKKDYRGTKEEIIHRKEFFDLLTYLTKDPHYREGYLESKMEGKEIHTMCEFYDRAIERGREEERINTKRESARADEAEAKAKRAEAKVRSAESKAEKAETQAKRALEKAEAKVKKAESQAESERARADAAEARVRFLEARLLQIGQPA